MTSVRITIAESGVYCLTGPLDHPELLGAAIVIDASNVVLDLNGFRLGGFAGPTTDAISLRLGARAVSRDAAVGDQTKAAKPRSFDAWAPIRRR